MSDVRLHCEGRVGALFLSVRRLSSILLRSMFGRREAAYSEVGSAAGIAGCVVDGGSRQPKTPEIDFVGISTLILATLVAERM